MVQGGDVACVSIGFSHTSSKNRVQTIVSRGQHPWLEQEGWDSDELAPQENVLADSSSFNQARPYAASDNTFIYLF